MFSAAKTLGRTNPSRRSRAFPSVVCSFAALVLLFAGLLACPPPPKPRQRARTTQPPPSYPYRGKTIRVDGRIHIFDRTKTRALGVLYRPAAGGLTRPVGIVGVDPRRGSIRWTKAVNLKLRDPKLPWSFELARNVTYLAAWVDGAKIRAFDIYGRDAWTCKLEGALGVSKIGEGFITARGSKIYFIERRSGKASAVADLGAPITAPLVALHEGEVMALTDDFLVGVNLDAPRGKQVIFRHRLSRPEGLVPTRPQVKGDMIVVGSKAKPLIIKTEVSRLDPVTLKPRWRKLIPGRVRSHSSLFVLGNKVRIINRVPGRPDRMFILDGKDGKLTGTIQTGVRRGCQYGTNHLFCVTKSAVIAYDKKTLREVWRRETLEDIRGNQHFPHGSTFFIAEGRKVVGVGSDGRVNFSYEIKSPPFRPSVNRVLGVVKSTLIITVVDWVRQRGMAQVWGIDLKTGKRRYILRWNMFTATPAYAEKAVALKGDRLLVADGVWIRAYNGATGVVMGGIPHRIRAPKTKIPAVKTMGGRAWLERVGTLAMLSSKGRILWRHKLAGGRVLAVGPTLMFIKAPGGEIRALDMKKGGRVRWRATFSPTLRPNIVEVPGGVILSHHELAVVLDPATGKKKSTWKPGGWHLTMMGKTPLLLRVLTFRPKDAGVVEAVRFDRESKKATRAWVTSVPRPATTPKPLPSAVAGLFPWFSLDADLVMYPTKGGRCLVALDLFDGKQRWKKCNIAWPAPPRAYGGKLYAATGQVVPGTPEEQQGLFAIDEGNGTSRRLFKIPLSSGQRFMLPQYGPLFRGEFFVLTQGPRLRQLFLAPPPRRRP